MKKMLFLALLCWLAMCSPALAQEALSIDDQHLYPGMKRAYKQGYVPTITGNSARTILPLLPGECVGPIQVELRPSDWETTPIKLSNDLETTVVQRTFALSGERISAYLIDYSLALHAARLDGEYPFVIEVRGQTESGEPLHRQYDFVLRVAGGLANDELPELAIDAFSADPLEAGGESLLRLALTNKSATREAKNVHLTIGDSSGDILPLDADTVSIGNLLPGETAHREIPIRALSSAAAQPHAVELSLRYNYGENRQASTAERRTVLIDQRVQLEHTEAKLPTPVTQGENIAFNLTLMNMGKGDLHNVLLTFDIPHLANGGSVLAGTIEPGKSAPVTANLRVDADFTGEASGTLTLTWEDGYGKPYEKTIFLSTNVLKKAALPPSAPATGNASEPAAEIALREMIAWAVAALLLLLLIIRGVTATRKIQRLEERQL